MTNDSQEDGFILCPYWFIEFIHWDTGKSFYFLDTNVYEFHGLVEQWISKWKLWRHWLIEVDCCSKVNVS